MSPKRFLAALTLVLGLFSAAPARADDQTDFEKARAAYEAKNYDDADRRLWSMLNADSGTLRDPSLRARARMYWAATMLARKNPQEAAEQFEKLLVDEDPGFDPDPLSFPSDVIESFIDTRKRIIDKINAAKAEQARKQALRRAQEEDDKRKNAERQRLIEKMATEEKITERHSRYVALLPFGVGQFQNGQKALGWVFLGAEAAFLIGAGAAFPFYVYNRGRALNLIGTTEPTQDPLKSYIDRANTASLVNGVFNVAFAVTAVAGIVHAQVTFVPQADEVKKRPLPRVGVAPVVAPARGGGVLGLEGTF